MKRHYGNWGFDWALRSLVKLRKCISSIFKSELLRVVFFLHFLPLTLLLIFPLVILPFLLLLLHYLPPLKLVLLFLFILVLLSLPPCSFALQALVFTCLQYKSFENTVGKGEIARNEQFLLFPQCFLLI